MTKKWRLFLLLAGCVTGCGQVADESSTTAPMTIALPIFSETSLPGNLEKVVLEISGEGFPTIKESLSKPFTESVEFDSDVPIGKDREFKVTVTRAHSTRTGYIGSARSDVTAEGATVPLNLRFVNFISDLLGERSGPDLSFVSIALDTKETADVADDVATLKIDFRESVESSTLAVFIEFDKDDDATTGRATTIAHDLRGSMKTNFTKGSERYFLAEKVSSGYTVSLYDDQDAKVDVPESAQLSASLTSSTQLSVTIAAAAFSLLIDSNGKGAFNVTAGEKSSLDPLVAPGYSSFTASDIALENETIATAVYDAYFDTSSL